MIRVHKNTTNCMDTAADFSSVLGIVADMKKKEKEIESSKSKLPPAPPPPKIPKKEPSSSSNNARTSSGYSRYDQEVFQNDEADEFQIQTGMSLHDNSFDRKDVNPFASSTTGSLKRPYPDSSVNGGTSANVPVKRTSRTPIIVIPASEKALISMYNASDILQDYKFISTEDKKRMNHKRENEFLIHHRKENGQTVPYRIVDNPLKLNAEEWTRVVAVFVQGPAWQFKGWNWGGNPTTIFSHVCAFHLKFEDAKLDANVAQWSVEILQLSKLKRHLDKAIFNRLWQKIEHFIIRNKPGLRC